jgi:hypothetical protein
MMQKSNEPRFPNLIARAEKEFTRLEDGYLYWFPCEARGGFSSYYLRLVADRLDEMNEDWELAVASSNSPSAKE